MLMPLHGPALEVLLLAVSSNTYENEASDGTAAGELCTLPDHCALGRHEPCMTWRPSERFVWPLCAPATARADISACMRSLMCTSCSSGAVLIETIRNRCM